jgi:hypothetical protein
MIAQRIQRRASSTDEQLGLFGSAPEPEPPRRPCQVCSAWGAFGMSWPLSPKPLFWCATHLPADYYTRKPQ